jgi:PIN domain nuclease of toxin-antitoxin system
MEGPACVLDASALLVCLQDEPGAERVLAALATGAAMSAANLAEVLSKLAEAGKDPDEAARKIAEGAAIELHPLDEAAALEIAKLRPKTKAAGLSLGDRACLALARTLDLPVLTADKAWSALKLGVKVETVR